MCLLGGTARLAAQDPPPINGFNGTSGATGATIAVEGAIKKVYGAGGTPSARLRRSTAWNTWCTSRSDLVVHGGKGTGVNALQGLRDGSSVVVHYTVKSGEASAEEVDSIGDTGLKVTEGVVTRVNRRGKEITVRFDNGTSEVFQLTDRAALDAGKDVDDAATGGIRVTIYYTDEAGRKVAHLLQEEVLKSGAGDGDRTRDIKLGKLAFYR